MTVTVDNTVEDLGRPASPPSEPAAGRRSARSALGPAFRRLWTATAVSSVGDGLALVAFPLLAASLTSSPTLVAGVLFAQRLPWLLVGLHAGALADRLPRLRLMAWLDTMRCAVVLLVGVSAASETLDLAPLYLAAFVLGAIDTCFSGAAHAVLPELVPEDGLERANGYLIAAQMGGEQMAGPAAGGLVFAAAAGLPFIVDGVTFGVSALLLAALATRAPRTSATRPTTPLSAGRLTRDVRAGLAVFRSIPALRLLALVVGGLATTQAMVMSVLVLFALGPLHLTGAGYGVLLGAAAVGNVAGSLLAARLRARLGSARLLTTSGAAAAVAYLVMASTGSAVVAGAGLFVECIAVSCGSVASVSLRQRTVPRELLGRVGNAFRVCIWGLIPVGALLGGAVASWIGLRGTFLVAGAGQLVLIAASRRRLADRVADLEVVPTGDRGTR